MHWVDRGPEPNGLNATRVRYTPRWVDYYEYGIGNRPTDSRWRAFAGELREAFGDICGYCESVCRGEVDHFRPKASFPRLAYEWFNWVFACHDCNNAKSNKWPPEGYVDPCAEDVSFRPEVYFTFDTMTGEIIPRNALDQDRFEKAVTMIDDLNLNGQHHLKNRLTWLQAVAWAIPHDPVQETAESEVTRRNLASRSFPWSSLARVWLVERGYSNND